MQRTDYAQVQQLAKDILLEYKRMCLLTGQLQTRLQALERSFIDDDIHSIKVFTNNTIRNLAGAQEHFFTVATELSQYAQLLQAGKGNGSGQLSDSLSAATGNPTTAPGSSTAKEVPNHYRDNLGVMINGPMPEGYMNTVTDRHWNAEPAARKVFDHFARQLRICSTEYPPKQSAHYAPWGHSGHPQGVYLNAAADLRNRKGAGTTYFHELAHMIDHVATGYQGNLSDSEEFKNALIEDGQNILAMYKSMPPEQQDAFWVRIHGDQAHSFSDLIDGITDGELHGSYGHDPEYWARPGNLQGEAFAHFFEASMGGGVKFDLLSNFFPKSYKIFSDILNSAVPTPKTRILRR